MPPQYPPKFEPNLVDSHWRFFILLCHCPFIGTINKEHSHYIVKWGQKYTALLLCSWESMRKYGKKLKKKNSRQWQGHHFCPGLPEVQGSKTIPVWLWSKGWVNHTQRNHWFPTCQCSVQSDIREFASVCFLFLRWIWPLTLSQDQKENNSPFTCLLGNLIKPNSCISTHLSYSMLDYIVSSERPFSFSVWPSFPYFKWKERSKSPIAQ